MKRNMSRNTIKARNILRIYCISDNYIISSNGVSEFHYSMQGSFSSASFAGIPTISGEGA